LINKAFSFVDLPGYGYAKVPVSVKKKWGPMVETYLSKRKTLRGVVVIIDIRRIPVMQDLQFLEWLHYYNIPEILIVTKVDKLSKTNRIKQKKAIADALAINENDMISFSAKTRMGKDAVWDSIEQLIGYHP